MKVHDAKVVRVTGRYPWRPICSCGQTFWGYVSEQAAQNIADDHNKIRED